MRDFADRPLCGMKFWYERGWLLRARRRRGGGGDRPREGV